MRKTLTTDFSHRLFSCLILTVAIAVLPRVCVSEEAPAGARGKMIVLIVDRMGIREWTGDSLDNLRDLESRGAMGLMVTRSDTFTPRSEPISIETSTFTTLGSGLPAAGNDSGRLAFNFNEVYDGRTAGVVYSLRTGRPAPVSGLVHLGTSSLKRINDTSSWIARPGALGGILRGGGYRTAVVGNSDRGGRSERSAAIIAMDERGFIDGGDVSTRLVVEDGSAVTRLVTNTDALKKAVLQALQENDFIVVDYGDTTRLNRYRDLVDPEVFAQTRRRIMRKFDEFAGFVAAAIDTNTTQLIVMSPTPPGGSIMKKETLTPLLVYGAGVDRRGSLLTSASTRRPGLVRNTDFAPHVCNFFGLPPAYDFIGAPFSFAAHDNPVEYLVSFHGRDVFVESRTDLLKNVIVWHLVMLFLCFFTVLRLDVVSRRWRSLLSVLILWTASMFLAFLFLAGLTGLNAPGVFLRSFLLVAAAIAIVAGLAPGRAGKMLVLAALYFIALAADQVAGGSLIKNSVLGYYPQVGARFYGIGNEYMGLMVGAPLVVFGLLLDMSGRREKFLRAAMLIVMAATVFIIGAPFIGANFGGLISALFGFTVMALMVWNVRFRVRTVVFVVAAVAAVAGIAMLADYLSPGANSHLGGLVGRAVSGGGIEELFKVAGRKLAVNFRLLRVSFWSALFVGSVALALAVHYFPIERLQSLFDRHGNFRKAYFAALAGALAAFLANDSGIVPGATALILPTATMFMLLFDNGSPPGNENRGEST